ncbi:MAG: hypothetical protein GX442_05715 [Candidatus Riflebacteria bacterium]|nr:hypothetical protein [Candidatus Riflebacteria bacterium]
MFSSCAKRLAAGVLVAVQLVVLAPAGPAQTPELRLRLSSEQDSRPAAPALGEFRISLDSQVLSPERGFSLIADEFQPPPFRAADRQLVLQTTAWEAGALPRPPGNPAGDRPAASSRPGRDLAPTLTWNAGYLHDVPDPADAGIGMGRRRGRWAVYGEFARQDIPPLPTVAPADRTAVPMPPRTLANISVFNGEAARAGRRPLDPHGLTDPVSSFFRDNYYLEAIYDFLPSFQGKVSYNRAVAETLDENEKLQVEGTVEAGKDVLIKAGFRNERLPEVEHRRNAQDTKVWTEFILKF